MSGITRQECFCRLMEFVSFQEHNLRKPSLERKFAPRGIFQPVNRPLSGKQKRALKLFAESDDDFFLEPFPESGVEQLIFDIASLSWMIADAYGSERGYDSTLIFCSWWLAAVIIEDDMVCIDDTYHSGWIAFGWISDPDDMVEEMLDFFHYRLPIHSPWASLSSQEKNKSSLDKFQRSFFEYQHSREDFLDHASYISKLQLLIDKE